MSDHPDFTDSNVIAAQSQILFQDGAPVSIPRVQFVDCSLFASLYVVVAATGGIGDDPIRVQVGWTIAGFAVAQDEFTMWNNGQSPGSGSVIFGLPCKGDGVNVVITKGGITTNVSRTITGSTRTLAGPTINGHPGSSPGGLGGAQGQALAGSALVTDFFGPVVGPFDVELFAGTQPITAVLQGAYYDTNSVLQQLIMFIQGMAANTFLRLANNLGPNLALRLNVTNQTATATTFTTAIVGG